MKTISLRSFLFLMSVILILVPVLVLGLYNAGVVKQYAERQQLINLREKLQLAVRQVELTYMFTQRITAKDLLLLESAIESRGGLISGNTAVEVTSRNADGSTERVSIPQLLLGPSAVKDVNGILDRLTAKSQSAYSIFQPFEGGFLRVATSARNSSGERVLGTYIPVSSPVYQTVVRGGVYSGRAKVSGGWYSTKYKPIRAEDGSLVAVICTGVAEEEYLNSLFHQLAELVIGDKGHFFILNKEGEYVLSRNRQRDGENIRESVDIHGNKFIETMLETAETSGNQESQTLYYALREGPEGRPAEKVAEYTYLNTYGWIIATTDYINGAKQMVRRSFVTLGLIIAVSVLLGLLLSFYYSRILVRAFTDLQKSISEVGQGNLVSGSGGKTRFTEVRSLQGVLRGEMIPRLTGLLADVESNIADSVTMSEVLEYNVQQNVESMEFMSASAAVMLDETNLLFEQMQSAESFMEDMRQALDNLRNKIRDQLSSTTEISASIEEMNATLGNMTTVAKARLSNAFDLSEQNQAGKQAVDETRKMIVTITKDVESMMEAISVINNITSQTQLLAMNAAIEAAHAGDQGKGFAVVAGEMRVLSETTTEKGQRITKTLEAMIERIATADFHSGRMAEIIEQNASAMADFTTGFQEIVDSTAEVSAGSTQILDASHLLSDVGTQTMAEGDRINTVIQRLAEGLDATGASSRKNMYQVNTLTEIVGDLKGVQEEMSSLGRLNKNLAGLLTKSLDAFDYERTASADESIISMIRAHQVWVERVSQHLEGTRRIDVANLGDHHSCSLGAWLDKGHSDHSGHPAYRQLADDHERLHEMVRRLISETDNDEKKQAEELRGLSHAVIRSLLILVESNLIQEGTAQKELLPVL